MKRLLIGFTVISALTWAPAFAQQVIAVKDLGAKCDGTTDDAPAIQKANDSLTAGGTVRLPAATCFIGATTINLGSNVTLQGEGQGKSIISSNGGDRSQLKASNKTNVMIRDLT